MPVKNHASRLTFKPLQYLPRDALSLLALSDAHPEPSGHVATTPQTMATAGSPPRTLMWRHASFVVRMDHTTHLGHPGTICTLLRDSCGAYACDRPRPHPRTIEAL